MKISVFDRVENIVGKGENAVYQHFLLFPSCFQKVSLTGSRKVGIAWLRVKLLNMLNQNFPAHRINLNIDISY